MEYQAKIYQNPDGSPNEIKGYNAAKFADLEEFVKELCCRVKKFHLSPIDATQYIKKKDYELYDKTS